jgi:hypothetical protein
MRLFDAVQNVLLGFMLGIMFMGQAIDGMVLNPFRTVVFCFTIVMLILRNLPNRNKMGA